MSIVRESSLEGVNYIIGEDLDCLVDLCFCNETYYFSKEMLDNNVLMITTEYQIDGEDVAELEILHFNDEDAMRYSVFATKDYFQPLQLHMYLKELISMYEKYKLAGFIKKIVELSESSITASSQSRAANAKEIKDGICNKFDYIKAINQAS